MEFDVTTLDPSNVRIFHPTGSRYICEPPVMDTDEDYVVLVKDIRSFLDVLVDGGWSINDDNDEYDHEVFNEVKFSTARKGDLNLVIYESAIGYAAFVEATKVCKTLNLTDKDDRVMVFQAVCMGRGDHGSPF